MTLYPKLVSIIIPVYRVSDYIERCIQSVLRQTYPDIECIIVDDATPDDSIEKCEKLIWGGQNKSGISFQIIHHDSNKGLSAARNTGTDAAKGEYIFFLYGDDELTDDCIEKLMSPVMHDATIEMVMGNYLRCAIDCPLGDFDRKTLSLQEDKINSREAVRDLYFNRRLSQAAWNKLIKRDFIRRNQLSFQEGLLWEDTLWLFFVVKHLSHLYLIPDVTYHWMKRPNSITTGIKYVEQSRHWLMVYDEMANHFTQGEEGREASFHVKGLCYLCIAHPDRGEFRRTASKYRIVLWKDGRLKEVMILLVTVFLSRYKWGRNVFYRVANRRRIRMIKQ